MCLTLFELELEQNVGSHNSTLKMFFSMKKLQLFLGDSRKVLMAYTAQVEIVCFDYHHHYAWLHHLITRHKYVPKYILISRLWMRENLKNFC